MHFEEIFWVWFTVIVALRRSINELVYIDSVFLSQKVDDFNSFARDLRQEGKERLRYLRLYVSLCRVARYLPGRLLQRYVPWKTVLVR